MLVRSCGIIKMPFWGQAWELIPIIPAIHEVEIERIVVQD
jgi:hypothetical protein